MQHLATRRERRRRTPAHMTRDVGRRLLDPEAAVRGTQERLARILGVSVRTLRRWKTREGRGEAPLRWGRRPHAQARRASVETLVTEQRETQGPTAGWRPIARAIRLFDSTVPVRLVQAALSSAKASERRRERERMAIGRISLEVLAKDAIWCQDGAHLGRLEGQKVDAEVLRDVASGMTLGCSVGKAATTADVIRLLDMVRAARGGLPLVFQSDNGPAYTSHEMAEYFARNQVIHLRSRPSTPTDNPCSERGIGDLKADSGLGSGVELTDLAETTVRLHRSRKRLDRGRLRESRGWKTAADTDAEFHRAEAYASRSGFYREAGSAIERAVHGVADAKAARKAERDAIIRTLEMHGLAERWIGKRGLNRASDPHVGIPPARYNAPVEAHAVNVFNTRSPRNGETGSGAAAKRTDFREHHTRRHGFSYCLMSRNYFLLVALLVAGAAYFLLTPQKGASPVPIEERTPFIDPKLKGIPERTSPAAVVGEAATSNSQHESELHRFLKALETSRATPGQDLSVLVELMRPLGSGAVPGLLNLLDSAKREDKMVALILLGELGPSAADAVPAVGELLSQPDYAEYAARTLRRIGKSARSAMTALSSTLQGADDAAAVAAAEALAEIGVIALPSLSTTLGSPDVSVRRRSAYAIRLMNGGLEIVSPSLVRAATDDDSVVRAHVISSLAGIRVPNAMVLELLEAATKDADALVAETARRALTGLGR
jgi:transposase InsO family protein